MEEYNRAKTPSDTDYIDYIASSAERVGLRFTGPNRQHHHRKPHEMEWWTIDVTKVGRIPAFTTDKPDAPFPSHDHEGAGEYVARHP
jgi:hypothetical protein